VSPVAAGVCLTAIRLVIIAVLERAQAVLQHAAAIAAGGLGVGTRAVGAAAAAVLRILEQVHLWKRVAVTAEEQ
jgi:hypothetical protein